MIRKTLAGNVAPIIGTGFAKFLGTFPAISMRRQERPFIIFRRFACEIEFSAVAPAQRKGRLGERGTREHRTFNIQ
jgi:hypothetical protein